MKRLYLLTTAHLEDELWFRDEEDFKVAMNYIAIQAACCPDVAVYVFILMSNHVHFVLKGEREEVKAFVDDFKKRYSMYMQRKYGIRKFLRRNDLDIKLISYGEEAPEKVIAYVQMNCVAANICLNPVQYPWSTGNLFFNRTSARGTRLGDLSQRQRSKILHVGRIALRAEWILGEDGYILPQSYVDVKAVEAIFRTPKRMNFFLQTSSKARKRLESSESLPSFRDQTIIAAVVDLMRSMFHQDRFEDLSDEEKVEFARQVRFRFSSDAHQVARICGITYKEAAQLLNSI